MSDTAGKAWGDAATAAQAQGEAIERMLAETPEQECHRCEEAAAEIERLRDESAEIERRVNHMEDLSDTKCGQLDDSQAACRDMERQRNEALAENAVLRERLAAWEEAH